MTYINPEGKSFASFKELFEDADREDKAAHNFAYRFIRDTKSRLTYKVRDRKDKLLRAHQRLQRGYDGIDVWNLDQYIGQKVGAILLILSKDGYSHPSDWKYEDWQKALGKAGAALSNYGKGQYVWDDEAETRLEEAKSALHWVADNLGDLWD